MYVYIEKETAKNIIPDYDSAFPNVPVEERYSPEYLAKCEHFHDDAPIKAGMVRDESGNWNYPPVPPAPTEPEPTPEYAKMIEQNRADIEYISMMTGVDLE